MKKRTSKAIAAILLTTLTLGVFTGCGDTKTESSTEESLVSKVEESVAETSTNSTESPVETEPQSEDDTPIGMQKYETPVTISTVLASYDGLERMLAETEAGETLEDNRYTRWYKEALNIELVYDWIAKGDAYNTKLNLTLTSNDIPDVMPVSANQAKQLYEAGKILSLTDIYDTYATEETKAQLNSDVASEQLFDAVTFDGELYALPKMTSSYDMGQYLWVRKDWLEKYDLPEPLTMDDVITIAKKFASEDPDGNGINDTVGLGLVNLAKAPMGGISGFLNGYHAYWNMYLGENGNIEYSSFAPEVKTALAALQDLYQSGAISKEYTTTDHAALSQLIISGKCGMVYGEHWIATSPMQESYNFDNAEWVTYPIPSCDDQPAYVQMAPGTSQFWVVSKDCEHPEALIKMINIQCTIPEKDWPDYVKKGDVSSPTSINPMYLQDPLGNIKVLTGLRAYLNGAEIGSDEIPVLATDWIANYEKWLDGDQSMWNVDRLFGPNQSSVGVMYDYIQQDRFIVTSYVGAPTESMTKYGSTLDKLLDEALVGIIAGGEDVSVWDQVKETWLATGGQDILNEINEQ